MTTTAVADRVGPPPRPGWLRRHSELIVVAGVLALAVFLTVETIRMEVPDGAGTPGPRFFPILVAGFLYVLAVLLTVQVLRHPEHADREHGSAEVSTLMLEDMGHLDDTGEMRVVRAEEPAPQPAADAEPDLRTVGLTLGALVVFVLILVPAGWLISATFLFWAICYVFGSRRPVFDLAVAALVASVIQLAFSAALGLTLPAGIFAGALSWTS
ncbi:tripartite tricarboxylate transporter TctB family protein [Nocardia puris]|uniref:Putative tricarboxylic transport membrane protein n=1 Tax=Nocardia puris TaxID=208602 RepID=A0A366DVR8_9NOCA|nr:tripartite tricarboxylate transporter TctB family protein [Nocardia puris]RBO94015.1 putative tricarboxylic transport membrane protein [Nocardia puris]